MNSHRLLIFFASVALMLLTGPLCSRPAAGADVPDGFPVSADDYPAINGSTSTSLLMDLIASRAAGLKGEIRRIPGDTYEGDIDTARIVFPLDSTEEQLLAFERLSGRVGSQGTHGSYGDLIGGKSELILVARVPSPDELKVAADRKVQLDVRPLALDGLVFIANYSNPVQGLSLEQVRNVFTGKTRFWRELGGKDFPIKALIRERNSGSQELMEKLVLQGRKSIEAPQTTIVNEMGQLINLVANNSNAVGYSVFYYEQIMNQNHRVKLLAIDGITPSKEAIRSHTYPLVEPVYVVTSKDLAPTTPAARLRDWLLTDDGQRLVADSGYVPIR